MSEEHIDIIFDDELCQMYTAIIKQDIANIKVLFHIASCEQSNVSVTVKNITDNVKIARRVGIKDAENTLISFTNKDDFIDRKTAERIVDRLAYASLISYDIQLPFKFIRLTSRGIQVAIHIKKSMGVSDNG